MRHEIELYEHNEKAYGKLLAMLDEEGRACIVHPTGTGKAVIGFKYALDHPRERIAWLAPHAHIFDEQLRQARRYSHGADFLNVKFMTYAGAASRARAGRLAVDCDALILDEFHHAGAPWWRLGYEEITAQNPGCKVIGMSATSIRYSDAGRDMAAELFGGHVASEMTLMECWDAGILPIPDYVTCAYDKDGMLLDLHDQVSQLPIGAKRSRFLKQWSELRDAASRAENLPSVFARHLDKPNARVIAFCSGVDHLDEVAELAGKWLSQVNDDVHVYKVHSANPHGSEELGAFRADASPAVKMLCCIDQLNEGLHMTGVDAAVLARRTASPTVFYQQLGRVLDASGNRVPLVFDLVDNYGCLRAFGLHDAVRSHLADIRQKQPEDDGARKGRSSLLEDFKVYDYLADVRRFETAFQMAKASRLSTVEELEYLSRILDKRWNTA